MESLKILRESNQKTQAELAELLGISPQGYAFYESGKRKITADKLLILSDYYNVPIDVILAGAQKTTDYLSNACGNPKIESLRKLAIAHKLTEKEYEFLNSLLKLPQHKRLEMLALLEEAFGKS